MLRIAINVFVVNVALHDIDHEFGDSGAANLP
jgi:hypothetical protein